MGHAIKRHHVPTSTAGGPSARRPQGQWGVFRGPWEGRKVGEVSELPAEVRGVLARQDGVISRAQLLSHGVSAESWRWNAGRRWRLVLPRVVLVDRTEPTRRQRLVAARLWAGPRSVLAGPTAASWHGIRSADPGGEVQLLLPRPASVRRSGFASVRRSTLVDPGVVTSGPLRFSSAARSAVDAAVAARSEGDAAAILIESVQRGVATLDDLAEWVYRCRVGPSVQEALRQAASGAWSRPEAELLDLVATSQLLPRPWANPGLFHGSTSLLTPDVWFDDVALAVMVHSHRHHAEGDHWDETVDADGALTAAAVVVVGVTPRRVRQHPDAVLARIEAAYRVASARPRPPVRAEQRSPWGPSRRAG